MPENEVYQGGLRQALTPTDYVVLRVETDKDMPWRVFGPMARDAAEARAEKVPTGHGYSIATLFDAVEFDRLEWDEEDD